MTVDRTDNSGYCNTSIYSPYMNEDKTCSTCTHYNVCKYREKTENALKVANNNVTIGVPHVKVKIECEYYDSAYRIYPTITYTSNENSVSV